MKYKIQAFSSRSVVENILINQDFTPSEDEKSAYFFKVKLVVTTGKQECAIIEGFVYDNNKIINDHEDIVDLADSIDGDNAICIYELYNSDLYKKDYDNDFTCVESYVLYMSKLYVFPTFRKKGIGSFLVNNIFEIFKYSYNINIHCIVTYPKPQSPTVTGWEDTYDESGIFIKEIVSLFVQNGFSQLNFSNCYAINFFAENDSSSKEFS